MPRCFSLVLLLLLGLTACQGQVSGNATRAHAPGFDIGPLPVTARHASDTSLVFGNVFEAVGDGTSISDRALIIDGNAIHFSWARYALAVPVDMRLNSISLDVQAASPNEYWVGLANYSRDAWEWHGPYSANASVPVDNQSANYVSPAGTFYWAVVAARDNALQLNFTTVDYTSVHLYVPPEGQQTILTGGSLTPALALNSSDHAPLIAYIHTDGTDQKLYLAYYDGSAWVQQPVSPEHDFSLPKLRWLGTEWIITAYDRTAGALVDIRISRALLIKSVTTIMANPGLSFANQSLDVSSTGEIGLAHGYAGSTAGQLYYSWNDGTGWQSTAALHDGDPVTGISFRYDPQAGADPWLIYTHGTTDTSSTIIITYVMEEGRQNGGAWTFTPISYPDSPLTVDLGFKEDGTPQLCFLASRVYSYSFFGNNFTGSLLYDVVAGTRDGLGWSTDPVFTATITPHYSFPNSFLTINVNDGAEVDWAKEDELLYAGFAGSVDIDIATQKPTGGTLTPSVQYMADTGSGFTDTSFFDGLAGRSFSWGWYPTVMYQAAAYIKSDTVDPLTLMGGQVDTANDLLYWSYQPPIPPP
jgi:hypothetical protein